MIYEILCFFSWRSWRLGSSIVFTTQIGLLYLISEKTPYISRVAKSKVVCR